jgi:hypothetical protein
VSKGTPLILQAHARGLAAGGRNSALKMMELAKKKPWRWRTARADRPCW